jgi:hypothetical protein
MFVDSFPKFWSNFVASKKYRSSFKNPVKLCCFSKTYISFFKEQKDYIDDFSSSLGHWYLALKNM